MEEYKTTIVLKSGYTYHLWLTKEQQQQLLSCLLDAAEKGSDISSNSYILWIKLDQIAMIHKNQDQNCISAPK